ESVEAALNFAGRRERFELERALGLQLALARAHVLQELARALRPERLLRLAGELEIRAVVEGVVAMQRAAARGQGRERRGRGIAARELVELDRVPGVPPLR